MNDPKIPQHKRMAMGENILPGGKSTPPPMKEGGKPPAKKAKK